ncbi:hypothetical protein [Arthrobacter sp. NPDC093139]|uniref:hypothetical protein n=1 Tax=Arthrobacter sp. NPDC093139 TaxID=3363945 RepID=UPI0038068F98
MASSALPWSALRPLRPVLIAGAAAVAWLSFTAPAADASTQQGQDSLLGGISSAVTSSLNSESKAARIAQTAQKTIHSVAEAPARHTHAVAVPAPGSAPIPQAAPPVRSAPQAAPRAIPSLVNELAAPLQAAADTLAPVKALPADTATLLTAPVTTLADPAVSGIAEKVAGTVVRPVTEAAPALEPHLESIADVLEGTPPLAGPAVTPVVDVIQALTPSQKSDGVLPLPAVPGPASSESAESARVSTAHSPVPVPGAVGSSGPRPLFHAAAFPSLEPVGAAQSRPGMSAGGGTPFGGEADPAAAPLPTPPAGSGSGNGQSAGGPSPSAAWLTSPFGFLPPAGRVPASGPPQHVPSPVAIDPGSSPD